MEAVSIYLCCTSTPQLRLTSYCRFSNYMCGDIMARGLVNKGSAASPQVNPLLELPVAIMKPVEHIRVLLLREVSPGKEPALSQRNAHTKQQVDSKDGGDAMKDGSEKEEGKIAAALAAAALEDEEKKEPRAVQASANLCTMGAKHKPYILDTYGEHAV